MKLRRSSEPLPEHLSPGATLSQPVPAVRQGLRMFLSA